MRVVFEGAAVPPPTARIAALATDHGMTWRLRPQARRTRTLLLVSRLDHALGDLLYRTRIGELAMDPVAIVSSRPREAIGTTVPDDIAFHHLPMTDGKPALIEETGAELIVLARYMQVLSDALATSLAGRCINIHHSFLPGFKGARPYPQAEARGVKMIGATAHYVTGDLDGGPIIVQDVEPISHADTPDDLIARAATSNAACARAPCITIAKIASCSTAPRRWCSGISTDCNVGFGVTGRPRDAGRNG